MITRRVLLQTGGMAAFAAGVAAPMFFSRAAQAATGGNKKILVVVYQRFGMDGLIAVTPYANESLAKLRPDLMLPAPDSGKQNALVDLGSGYGLNPSLAALAPLYKEGSLAFIHAAGSPDNTRSHLDAAQWWESGTPGNKATADGWLNRAVSAAGTDTSRALRAVSMTPEQPRALYGVQPVVAITDLNQLEFAMTQTSADSTLRAMQAQYNNSSNASLRHAAQQSVEVALVLTAAKAVNSDASYPNNSPFANSLRDIATLIKADVGLQVAFAESRSGIDGQGSWDTHSYALDPSYQFAFPQIAQDFSNSLAAFWRDLGTHRDDVVLVTHTDFGRNVVQNDKRGCDHGRATTMMVLGNSIKGGQMHGHLPERFDRDALEDKLDLPVTTDYRSVLAELAGAQLGIRPEQDAQVFPGFTGRRLNLARS